MIRENDTILLKSKKENFLTMARNMGRKLEKDKRIQVSSPVIFLFKLGETERERERERDGEKQQRTRRGFDRDPIVFHHTPLIRRITRLDNDCCHVLSPVGLVFAGSAFPSTGQRAETPWISRPSTLRSRLDPILSREQARVCCRIKVEFKNVEN